MFPGGLWRNVQKTCSWCKKKSTSCMWCVMIRRDKWEFYPAEPNVHARSQLESLILTLNPCVWKQSPLMSDKTDPDHFIGLACVCLRLELLHETNLWPQWSRVVFTVVAVMKSEVCLDLKNMFGLLWPLFIMWFYATSCLAAAFM